MKAGFYNVLRPINWDADGLEICRASDGFPFFGTHLREEQYLLDAVLVSEHHGETVDTDSQSRGWWHTVFQGANEVHIDEHCLVVSFFRELELVFETLQLVNRIIELRIGVGHFLTVDHQLKTLRELWVVAVLLTQRRHLHGVVGDEGGLDVVLLTFFAEDFVDQLAFTHGLVYLEAN